jgi:polysaccharide pyruvyl transferase WcaK-like protein
MNKDSPPAMDRPLPSPLEQAGPKIGVLGHFGDHNLGDEAIIEAFVQRMRRDWPHCELRIFSMHPSDSAQRYGCQAYALRRETENETEFRVPQAYATGEQPAAPGQAGRGPAPAPPASGVLERIAALVPKGRIRSSVGAAVRGAIAALREAGFLWRSLGRVRGLDAMYVTGSNQFLDNFGGAWGFPYTLLKWSVLCRLVGCRVAFVSVGAGPLDGALSKWMIARALALSDYVSFRDEGSRALVFAGCGRDGPVLPDVAHSLEVSAAPSERGAGRNAGERPLRIAINAMPVHDPRYWHAADARRYEAYYRSIGTVARQLQGQGFEVSFFATQFPDAAVAHDAISAAWGDAAAPARPAVDVPRTVAELMQVLVRADLVVATRFHGILLALLAGKPTVGICYYRKSRELLAEAGAAEFGFDIDDFDAPRLLAAVGALSQRRAQVATTVAGRVGHHRKALDRQYRTLQQHLSDRLPGRRR